MAEQPPTAIPSTQGQNESPAYGRGLWISYKVDIRSRLRSSINSFARFLRIMPQPSYDPLEEFKSLKEHKTGFAYVEGFYTALSSLYKSAATCSIDRNRWKVTKISTYKSIKGVEHESLVADFVCGEVIVYLRIERKLHKSRVGQLLTARKPTPKIQPSDESDPSSDNPTSPHDTPPRIATRSSRIGKFFTSSKATPKPQKSDRSHLSSDNTTSPHDTSPPIVTRSMSKYASDEMTYSKVLTSVTSGGEECVDIIRFPEGKGLSLPQIAVLAYCVNSLVPGYSVIEENCYWFAHVMVEAVKLIEPNVIVSEETSKRKPGTFKFLSTPKPTPELIEKAKSTYDKKWVAFDKDIYDTINNENSEIYQKERQKREEAERIAAEAERLAAEKEEENKALKAQLAAALAANGANSSSS